MKASIRNAIAAMGYLGPIRQKKKGRPKIKGLRNPRDVVREVEVLRDILREQKGRIKGVTAEAVSIVAEWRSMDENTIRKLLNRPKKDRRRR